MKEKMNKFSLNWSSISVARPILMVIAIVWIILFHSNAVQAPENAALRVLWYFVFSFGGGFGVDIFLVLSGFGLIYSHNKTPCYGSIKKVLSFYLKRFSRIVFSYTLIFIVYYVIYATKNGGSVLDFFAKYTIYELFATGFREFWFIHAIAVLYLIFPVIAWLYDKLNLHIAFLITALISVGIEFAFYYFNSGLYSNCEIFITRIICFAIGCYFGCFSLNKKSIRLIEFILYCLAFISALIFIFLTIHFNIGSLRLDRYLFAISTSLLIIVISPLITLLANKLKWMSWLGQFTLQVYLIHILLFGIISPLSLNPILVLFIVFVSSFIISIALFYTEKYLKLLFRNKVFKTS